MATATSHDPRGRDAATPTQMPAKGWTEALKRAWKESGDDNLNLIAAGVSFYAFLTIVPILGALVLVYGFIADPATLVRHVQSLASVMPAEAAKLIGEQLMGVVTANGSKKGLGVLLALGLALYGASKGMGAIVTALNIAYDEKEKRGFFKRLLLTLAMVVGALLLVIMLIFAGSVTGALGRLLPFSSPVVVFLLKVLSWVVTAALLSAGIAALYRYAPARDKAKWSWLTPGSIIATVGIGVASILFGIYVSNFGNYNATWGSLGAVVVLLTWLNLSAFILLLGAEVNAELEHQTERDTTSGPEQPLGTRGAEMADRVAPEA